MTNKAIYNVTQKQIDNFKPTFLYIKQHTVTGKLYFGKHIAGAKGLTVENYNGSGSYWGKHIRKNNVNHVITIWFCLFTDIHTLVEFSVNFCLQENIGQGDTTIWANLIPETGLNGGSIKGRVFSEEHKKNLSKAKIGKKSKPPKHPEEKRRKQSLALSGENNPRYGKPGTFLGKTHTDEAKLKVSLKNTGKKHTPESIEKIAKAASERPRIKNICEKCGFSHSWKRIFDQHMCSISPSSSSV